MRSIKNLTFGILAIALIFTSCEKQIESSPVNIDKAKQATVNFIFTADINLSLVGEEAVPEGTLVNFSADIKDFANLDPANNTGRWSVTDTIGADGKLSLQVPCDDNGVTLRILVSEFITDQTYNSSAIGLQTATRKANFSLAEQTCVVVPNAIYNKSYSLTSTIIGKDPNTNITVEIKGIFKGELDSTGIAGLEKVDNTKITFYTKTGTDITWSIFTTTDANGNYKIEVPVNKTIYYKYEFDRNIKAVNGGLINMYFATSDANLGSFSTKVFEQNITLVNGVRIK